MSMISLLLTPEVKPRTSVNNKDIIQMYLGYNLLIPQRTIPINTSFVAGITSNGFTYQSFLWFCSPIKAFFAQSKAICFVIFLGLDSVLGYLDIILTTVWQSDIRFINL